MITFFTIGEIMLKKWRILVDIFHYVHLLSYMIIIFKTTF